MTTTVDEPGVGLLVAPGSANTTFTSTEATSGSTAVYDTRVYGAEPARPRRRVQVGFDGVLHSYTSGWLGACVIPDPPVAGAIEWLNEVFQEFDIEVVTPRARDERAEFAIRLWLTEHGFVGASQTFVTAREMAVIFVDPRAWRFKGRFPSLHQLTKGGLRNAWRSGDPTPEQAAEKLREQGAKRRRQSELMHAKLGRLNRERAELYETAVRAHLAAAGVTGEVADEWWRQHQGMDFAQRLAEARKLSGVCE